MRLPLARFHFAVDKPRGEGIELKNIEMIFSPEYERGKGGMPRHNLQTSPYLSI
jgi:hypothetical protein